MATRDLRDNPASRVLLYGGSFDPVHIGHVRLGDRARAAALGEDAWLVVVPAARSPHKAGEPCATGSQRVAMLELAFAAVPRARVWTDELDRGSVADAAPSYWVHTLERARAVAGVDADLRFLIGTDQALSFHRWHRFRDILALARPVVMLREPLDTIEDFGAAMGKLDTPTERAGDGDEHTPVWSPAELAFWLSWVVELEVIDASSTLVRAAVRRGTGLSALRNLDPRVLAYINEHALYQHGTDAAGH